MKPCPLQRISCTGACGASTSRRLATALATCCCMLADTVVTARYCCKLPACNCHSAALCYLAAEMTLTGHAEAPEPKPSLSSKVRPSRHEFLAPVCSRYSRVAAG